MAKMKYDRNMFAIHQTKNPPWSQAICGKCYVKRFGVECNVFSFTPRHLTEPCHDCGRESLTEAGGCIYFDARDPTHQSWSQSIPAAEVAEWNKFVATDTADE